jgi:predicted nucleotidyltransferase
MCARCKSRYFGLPKLRIPTYGSGLGIEEIIGARRVAVLRLAKRFGARNVRVFGSVARREATETSDVDLLVDPVRSRFDSISLVLHLQEVLGRDVDLVSEKALHWFVQPQVVAEAVPL